MKKKILVGMMAMVMALAVTACGKEKDSLSSSVAEGASYSEEGNESEETKALEQKEEVLGNDKENTVITSAENPFGETVDINQFISSKEIDPPLWKVTDPESGNSMYLLGTIHLLPVATSDYPSDLMEIYNSCDSIAVEYDISALMNDMKAQMEYAYGMLYSDGTTIQDHISEETYNKAKEYFESIGAYNQLLDMYNAGYWINQLSTIMYLRLENVELTGTDMYFITKAQEDGKEVINIEDLTIQTGAINAYTDDYADYTMSEMLDNMDDINAFAEEYAELYELWAQGDGEIGMDSEELDRLPDELKDDYEAYIAIMLDNRNQNMADKASEYIKEGKNCLFMVGAAHYSGENGVDNLLEKMGYQVEKID